MTVGVRAATSTAATGHWSARRLDVADLEAAARLLGAGLAEMPVYRGILGGDVVDPDVRTGLARILLRPLIDGGGRVAGVDGGDGLVGLVAWFGGGVDGAGDADPSAADAEFLLRHPALARRLLASWREPLPTREPDGVTLQFIVVDPRFRHRGVMLPLVDEVIDHCVDADTFFYAWTGVAELRDRFCDGWGLTQFATHTLSDGTVMYGITTERAPVASRSTARPTTPLRSSRLLRGER